MDALRNPHTSWRVELLKGVKVYKYKSKNKESTLDFTAPTCGADLRSLALQPGSAVGGRG